MIWYYRHSGVRIASALDLPEWKSFRDLADQCASERADVTIALSEHPLASTGMPDGTAMAQQGHIRFDVDDVGRWLVSEGRRIVIDPITIENGPELRLFTLGTAWAVLGYQRGWLMCHGSVVVPAGATKAVMLIGASGQGKSTTAAALVAAGGTLLADDLCRVESRAGGSAVVHPSARNLKLWGGAVEALGWEDRIVARDHFRADKFLCGLPVDAATIGEPLPVGAVVVLDWGEALSLQLLRGSDAITAVLPAACYRPQVLDALSAWPQQTKAWLTLLEHTPVYRLQRPKEFTQIPEATYLLSKLPALS